MAEQTNKLILNRIYKINFFNPQSLPDRLVTYPKAYRFSIRNDTLFSLMPYALDVSGLGPFLPRTTFEVLGLDG